MKALDVEAVQAFVLAADLKSFTRAAEAMDTTQSMVSLKIKRLEKGLGRQLLERTPRMVRLSADGAAFLGAARDLVAAHDTATGALEGETRRLSVGNSPHVIGTELPMLLKRLNAMDPRLVVEMHIATTREVLQSFDAGELDAALVLRPDERRRDGERLLEESFGWFGSPDFSHRTGGELRLATQAAPCSVRAMAIKALDRAGIRWSEVFVGGGIATIGAAISAGLAVAALATRVAPRDVVEVGPRLGLPVLPAKSLMLYSKAADPKTRQALRTLTAAFRSVATWSATS